MHATDILCSIVGEFEKTGTLSAEAIGQVASMTKSFSAGRHPVYAQVRQIVAVLTPACGADDPLEARLWVLSNNIIAIPGCKTCKGPVKWDKGTHAYRTFCSPLCKGADSDLKARTKQTTLIKYGGNSATCSIDVKRKIKQTWADKTKADLDTIRLKRAATLTDRFGVPNASQSTSVKTKKKLTSVANWGTNHPMQSSAIASKVTHAWTGKTPEEVNLITQARADTLLSKYGVHNASCYPEFQAKRTTTLLQLYQVHNPTYIGRTLEPFTQLADPLWCVTQHVENKQPLIQIADALGVGDTTVGRYLRKHGIRTQLFNASVGERELAQWIQSLGVEVVSNTRSIISPKELDIYLPDHKLAIEYCGLYWHSEQQGKDRQYHRKKYLACKEQGIQLLTIFEDEWMQRRQQVERKLRHLLGLNTDKIAARKTKCVTLDTKTKDAFFEAHHIQGTGPGSITYGLEHEGSIVAAMTFIQHAHGAYTLNRYATSTNVVGGFSKLLNHFKQHNVWRGLISFADLRWSDGGLYVKNGWLLDSILPPDYYYSPDGHTRFHKFNYRRKNLPKLLKTFDPALSEWENCKANDVLRIWDCGKTRYVMVK